MVNSDSHRLGQVVMNLLSNAIKFTDKEGQININCGPLQKDDKTYLQVSVEDTGIGISLEDQEKMFKLFGFLESSKSRNKGGIGLGLHISSQIVKEFGGGIIDLESEPDTGSKFTFKFEITAEVREAPKMSTMVQVPNLMSGLEMQRGFSVFNIDTMQIGSILSQGSSQDSTSEHQYLHNPNSSQYSKTVCEVDQSARSADSFEIENFTSMIKTTILIVDDDPMN